MRIILDSTISVEKNAARYFERGKKAKKKAEGARKAIEKTRLRMKTREKEDVVKERKQQHLTRKKAWYEKFRWFISSDDILCVAGKDAGTNEMMVKKHASKGDVVFHTDMAGSPFCVVQSEGKKVPKSTLEEAAVFTASFSRAWREGLGTLEVFHANPEQFSKTAESGEFIGKGAFMVRGKVVYHKPELGVCIGKESSGRVMIGPENAVKKHCGTCYQIIQGKEKASDVGKRLAKLLEASTDEIVSLLPAGGVKLGRRIRA